MKDKEKIEQVAQALWEEKCEFRKMFTPLSEPLARRVFIIGFEMAIDHIKSLPCTEGLEMIGYKPIEERKEPDFFEDFSPLEDCTM